ncbi:MAG: hypothetical protein ACLGIV_12730 [Actinomycetes bacterium]
MSASTSRTAVPVTTDVVKRATLEGPLREAAWALYLETFDELRTTALQRHLYTREEFDAVMDDERVVKYVGRRLRGPDDGVSLGDTDGADVAGLCALATFTDDLTTMPLISPDYFAARWPEHYARGRCFYIGFVAVHPDYHGTGVFSDIVSDMTTTVSEASGVAVLDVCHRNSERYRLPYAILRIARSRVDSVTGTPVDTQTYWAYEAPVATGALPSAVVDLREG